MKNTVRNFRRLPLGRIACAVMLSAAMLGSAQAQKFKVLYRFTGGADGLEPYDSLLLQGGELYGTALGGTVGDGIIFEINTESGQETILHTFQGGPSDGAVSYAGLAADAAGNLYGITAGGGAHNDGVIFELSSSGAFTLLHSFSGGPDGSFPWAGLVLDSAGNLYGTTTAGGTGYGTAFELGSGGAFSTLCEFTRATGHRTEASLLLEGGFLYGTALYGGSSNKGTVFQVDPASGDATALYSFTGGSDGAKPTASLLGDGMGNLYGTASAGGMGSRKGDGVVFMLNIASGQETVLHAFGGPDGTEPFGGLLPDPAGNLYGTTFRGGEHHHGVIFEIDAAGNFSVLHSFAGGVNDGAAPEAGLIMGPTGKLYGTTFAGGRGDAGTVFEITP
jgi:uncharacterized repeat protein (TIGR03803 family)